MYWDSVCGLVIVEVLVFNISIIIIVLLTLNLMLAVYIVVPLSFIIDIRADTYVIGVVIEHSRRCRAQDQSKSSC